MSDRRRGDRFEPAAATAFSVAAALLASQSKVLEVLMSDPVVTRLVTAEETVADTGKLLRRSELQLESPNRAVLQRLLTQWLLPQLDALRGGLLGLLRWALDVDLLAPCVRWHRAQRLR